jgi:hypothetical protein
MVQEGKYTDGQFSDVNADIEFASIADEKLPSSWLTD